MDEPRKRNMRWLLGIVAAVLAAGTLGVTSAIAGGGDLSPAAPSKAKSTPAAKAPAKAKAKRHSGHNCPRDSLSSSLDV